MSKRPSLISGLNLPTAADPAGEPPPQLQAETPAPQAAPQKPTPASGRRPRPDVVHTSVYLPREVHRRLREIAFTRDVKVHDVIMEGIDAALQKHGHPPSTRNAKGEE